MDNRVVFSVDDWFNLHTLAKFLRHIDTNRALNKLSGPFIILQGYYKGTPEIGFMCNRKDFDNIVEPSGYVDNQESIVLIYDDNTAFLKYRDVAEYLGTWAEVTKEEAVTKEGYSYDPQRNTWYTCT